MRHVLPSFVLLLALGVPAVAEDFDRILDAGVVKAGVCLTAEPIGFRDSEGNPRGYDVDVAALMAEALGVQLEIVEVTVATRITDLVEGRIDVIVCNMTATTERARTIAFSFPYLRTGLKLLALRGSEIGGLGDLGEETPVAVSRGTTGEQLLRSRAPDAPLVYAESSGEAVLLLRQGEAVAYVEDSLLVDSAARANPELFVALSETYTVDAVSFAVRRGNPDLLRWLDLFASTFVSSGRYQEVYGRWWGEPPPPLAPVW